MITKSKININAFGLGGNIAIITEHHNICKFDVLIELTYEDQIMKIDHAFVLHNIFS